MKLSLYVRYALWFAIFLKNLLHLPTSVNSRQDTALHILMVHQLQVRLMHNPIRKLYGIYCI